MRAEPQVARLADHPEALPLLARWFKAEWPGYYGSRSAADIEHDFARDEVLVALEGSVFVGTVSLRAHALGGHPGFSPGLGGLYVALQHRRRGVGSALVRAAMAMVPLELYTATARAGRLFERLGWHALPAVQHQGEAIAVYRWRNVPHRGRTKP